MNLPDIVVVALIAGLPSLIGTYLTMRRLPIEKTGIDAEANQDNATAQKLVQETASLRVEGYEKLFQTLMSRDADILTQNRRMVGLEHDIEKLTADYVKITRELTDEKAEREKLEQQLAIERNKRLSVEHERDSQADEIRALQTAMYTQKRTYETQIAEILQNVKQLQAQVLEVKQSPITGTSTFPAIPQTS